MLEGVLVDQRLGVARAQHDEIAPARARSSPPRGRARVKRSVRQPRLADCRASAPGIHESRASTSPARPGVSQSTVSLVLSGKSAGRISAKTEEAVRRAAEELGYRPNIAARALRTGAARSVGLVVPDVTHPFFGLTMRGAQEAAWSAGYAVALVDVPLDRPLEAPLEALRAGPADGFIYFSVEPPERRPGGERIVVIEAEPEGVPWVALDTAGGTDAALAHLIELGHRRIAPARLARAVPDVPDPQGALARGAGVASGVAPRATCGPARASTSTTPAAPAATLLDAADPPTADHLRRRHPRRRRLPGRPRARAADPRGPLGRGLRRPAVRARALAAADDVGADARAARRGRLRRARRR